jgi:hypothetical protein
LCLRNRVSHTHGGLTPAALDNDHHRSQRYRSPLQSRYGNHGGLTPAALVHVRLCIAKIVFYAGGRPHRNNKERGA